MAKSPDDRPDAELIHAIAQQDLLALAELYCRYAGRSLALAHRYGLPAPHQAVEVGFLQLFHSADGFSRSPLTASNWTIGMMHCYYCPLSPDARQVSPAPDP